MASYLKRIASCSENEDDNDFDQKKYTTSKKRKCLRIESSSDEDELDGVKSSSEVSARQITISLSSDEDDQPAKSADKGHVSVSEDEESLKENIRSFFMPVEEELMILSFINESSLEELCLIENCSRKKSEILISMRPFSNIEDLTERVDAAKKGMSAELVVEGVQGLLAMRENLNQLVSHCRDLTTRVDDRVNGLLSNPHMLADPDSLMEELALTNQSLSLKPYQMVGINWLRIIHEEGLNAILADEMGLGKTVQTIAFLAYLLQRGQTGPHLIMVPTSTLHNWCRELKLWCPALRVLVYHGLEKERREIRYDAEDGDFNVLVTTYCVGISNCQDRSFLKRMNFQYAIFDEAHMMKNMTSQRYKKLMRLEVNRRILLTGTPVQNNLLELFSLLTFVMPNIFLDSCEMLTHLFGNLNKKKSAGDSASNNVFEKDYIEQAKKLLRPFCLRRTKQQVMRQLPKKTEQVELLPLVGEHSTAYWGLVATIRGRLEASGSQTIARTKVSMKKVLNSESTSSEFKKMPDTLVISMITELRKCAIHPLLLRRYYTDDKLRTMSKALLKDREHWDADPACIFEDMALMSDFELHKTCANYKSVLSTFSLPDDLICDSVKLAYLDKELPKLIAAGDRVLIFSQFVIALDIIEDFFRIRGIRFLRLDGGTKMEERQKLLDEFNENEDIPVFLISTRAGGLGVNLTGANVVILHDIDYNPFNDKQAEDRAHRIGQTREVRIIRLISQNTVEEGMLRIATDKLRLQYVAEERGEADSEQSSTLGDPLQEDNVEVMEVKDLLKEALGTYALS